MALYSFGKNFNISKILDHGTNHPVVARLMIQTHEIIQFSGLPKEKKEKVGEISIKNIGPRLLRCFDIKEGMMVAARKVISETEEANKSEDRGRVVQKPHLIQLNEKIETFLYESKNFLRDFTGIINIFCETDFRDASGFIDSKGNGDGEIVRKLIEKYGENDDQLKC